MDKETKKGRNHVTVKGVSLSELLGVVPELQCDVVDTKGRHCPEKPIHKIVHNGKECWLCDRCYQNFVDGVYRKR